MLSKGTARSLPQFALLSQERLEGMEKHTKCGVCSSVLGQPPPQPCCQFFCHFGFSKRKLCKYLLAEPGASGAGALSVPRCELCTDKTRQMTPSQHCQTYKIHSPQNKGDCLCFLSILIIFRAICNNSRHNTAKRKCDFQVGAPFRKWISSIFQMSDRCAVKYMLEFSFGD